MYEIKFSRSSILSGVAFKFTAKSIQEMKAFVKDAYVYLFFYEDKVFIDYGRCCRKKLPKSTIDDEQKLFMWTKKTVISLLKRENYDTSNLEKYI